MIMFTGASGFIGSHFHEVLPNDCFVNLDLLAPRFPNTAKFYQGDIRVDTDVEKVLSETNCDLIISLAAEHKDFGISERDYFRTNEYGTKVICDAATKFKISKIIFYSSVAVYGANVEPSTESMVPNPNLPYGASKLAGEKILRKWAAEDSNRSVVIIRPAVVYGERNVANMFRLIEQIKVGRYFHIGKGQNVKSIAYVKNLVDATLFLKDSMRPGVEIYNYADSPQLSSRQISTIISHNLGRKEPLTFPYFIVYLMALPFDIAIKLTGRDFSISTNRVRKFCTETFHKADKINKEGFSPKFTNEEGLQNMVKWLKSENFEEEAIFDV